MRLLAASLIAGGCLFGAQSASAEAFKLDDATLDQVTAGETEFRQGTPLERRNFLIAAAAREIAGGIEDGQADPVVGAAFNFLTNLANELDPPPATDNGADNGAGSDFPVLDFPDLDFPTIANPLF